MGNHLDLSAVPRGVGHAMARDVRLGDDSPRLSDVPQLEAVLLLVEVDGAVVVDGAPVVVVRQHLWEVTFFLVFLLNWKRKWREKELGLN